MNFPNRLKYGQGFTGRDYPGCCNAGAPTMLKSRAAETYLGKPFAVGRVFEIRFNLAENISKAMAGRKADCRFFKTYSAAKTEFRRLSAAIDSAYNEVRESRSALNSNDPETALRAALTLSDHGMVR